MATGPHTTPILECRHLSVSYASRAGEVPALKDFNLKLMPGEAHGLVGESGCGKSTLALAVMQYLGRGGRIVGGEILFNGRDMRELDPAALRALRGADIAMIYQEPMASLNPSMTVGAQLAEVPRYHEGVSHAEARRRAAELLDRVHLPDVERLMRSYPHQLSGGQQQRIVIAMALLSKPKLLLLDEPTTALDVTVEAGIVDLIREISAQFGTSMLYISHNLGLILATCDRITVMYSGEAVETGPVATVFRDMRHPYTRGLLASIPVPAADKRSRPLVPIPGQLPSPRARPAGCYFAPRCAWAEDICTSDGHPSMRSADTPRDSADRPGSAGPAAHETRCRRHASIDWSDRADHGSTRATRDAGQPSNAGRPPAAERPPAAAEVVLRVESLSKHYGPVLANHRLSFEARRGETLALVGESGCGKSTFAKILMGLEPASGGSIVLRDLDLTHIPVGRRPLDTIRNLQMVFQNPFDTLNPSLTVGAQITRVLRKFGTADTASSGDDAVRGRRALRDRNAMRRRVLELLDTVKLPADIADRKPRQLSGGQKQRIGIARAFAGNPAMVVADEPVSALDVSVQAAVTELLLQIQRRENSTVIFISHDLSVVRYLADRILVMYLGRIMESGSTAEIFAPPYHPYTEALLSAVPVADPTVTKRRIRLSGDLPKPSEPPRGCPFNSRCGYKIPGLCDAAVPPLQTFGKHHTIACHLPRETLLDMPPVFT